MHLLETQMNLAQFVPVLIEQHELLARRRNLVLGLEIVESGLDRGGFLLGTNLGALIARCNCGKKQDDR